MPDHFQRWKKGIPQSGKGAPPGARKREKEKGEEVGIFSTGDQKQEFDIPKGF